MSGVVYLITLSVLSAYIFQRCDGYAFNTPNKIRRKIHHLMRELYADSTSKIDAIEHMKRYFGKSSVYHIAETLFNIRQKLNFMIVKYKNAVANKEKWTIHRHVEQLSDIQRMGTELENMVQMCIEFERLDPAGKIYARSGNVHRNDDKEVSLLRTQQQKQKSFMLRQKVLWAMLKGEGRNFTHETFKQRFAEEEGFKSDLE